MKSNTVVRRLTRSCGEAIVPVIAARDLSLEGAGSGVAVHDWI
jgi:hypothetical protein